MGVLFSDARVGSDRRGGGRGAGHRSPCAPRVAARRRHAPLHPPDRRRVVGHLAGRSARAGRCASSGRCPSSGSSRTGSRRSSATLSRRPGCAVRRRSRPRRCRELLGQDEAAGVLVMAYLDPADHRLWKADLRAGHADPDVARAVGNRLVRIHAATANDRKIAAAFATDRIFYDIRLEPYLVASARAHPDRADALHAPGRDHRAHQTRPRARRRQPEEHPDRAARAGLPRRRVRLVRRSGVRSRVLPEPPAAEVSLGAAGARAISSAASTCWPRAISPACAGSRTARSSGARRGCCPGCSSPGSTASRRSST